MLAPNGRQEPPGGKRLMPLPKISGNSTWLSVVSGIRSKPMDQHTVAAGKEALMKIAIPMAAGEFCEHFGGAREFLILEGAPDHARVTTRQRLAAPEHQPGALPRWLAAQQVDVVVVSAIGERALIMLAEAGIETRLAAEGMGPGELAVACLQGKLTRVNGENSRCKGGHHDHEHGPECQH
jgi:predicted Fe-Mo cluster-binding NifX family protein